MEWRSGSLTGRYSELNGTKIRVENIHYELSREDLVVRRLPFAQALNGKLTVPGTVLPNWVSPETRRRL